MLGLKAHSVIPARRERILEGCSEALAPCGNQWAAVQVCQCDWELTGIRGLDVNGHDTGPYVMVQIVIRVSSQISTILGTAI